MLVTGIRFVSLFPWPRHILLLYIYISVYSVIIPFSGKGFSQLTDNELLVLKLSVGSPGAPGSESEIHCCNNITIYTFYVVLSALMI